MRSKTKSKVSNNRKDATKCKPDKTVKSTNDPGWYASDPSILRDAASIPFSWALGTTIDYRAEGTLQPAATTIPGIARMDLVPTMGLSVTSDSALNIASTALYSYIRSANSGHSNYDAPDLMLYCGAMAHVYAYINWCQRIYGIATLYAQKNRYLPKALLESMDVDPDSIINNLANFRYWLNVMVAKASSLAVPATMSYFSRTAFLYSNIYCESESIKDQLYYFHPAAWYKFRFDSSTEAGMLESVKLEAVSESGLLTLSEIQRFGEEMLGVLITDEDFNIMSGDILKAYGIEHIIKLTSVPEYYPIIPIYDEMVLEQFHNANVITISDVDVVQDPSHGYLMCQPVTSDKADIFTITHNKLLSVNKAEPGPEDVIESSRLMLAGDSSRSTDTSWYVGCGTEVPSTVHLFYLNPDGTLARLGYKTSHLVTGANVQYVMYQFALIKSFKYFPRIFVFEDSSNTLLGDFASIDNYAVLSAQDIYKLHDVAIMNMLAVPSIAKVNRV